MQSLRIGRRASDPEIDGLTGKQMLQGVLHALSYHLTSRRLDLPQVAKSVLSASTRGKKQRIWYAGYKEVILLPRRSGYWALALGLPTGELPPRGFGCDLAAVPVQPADDLDVLYQDIRVGFEQGSGNHNSLLIAFFEGTIGLPPESGRFRESMAGLLDGKLVDYLIRDAELYEPQDPRQRPTVGCEALYHVELSMLLFEAIRNTLTPA